MTTLCGQVLGDGAYLATDAIADCANCIRRSRDQSRVSSAFFESDEGSELLRLSLEHAKQRQQPVQKQDKRAAGADQGRPHLRVVPPAPAPAAPPEALGELEADGFKRAGDGVWRSPDGVIVRMGGPRRDRFAELVYGGEVVVRREDAGLSVRAADVEVRPVKDGYRVRLRRR